MLRIPESKLYSQTLSKFIEGHQAFAKAGINVINIFPESHAPDFLVEEYVRHISLRAALLLLKDNNPGYVIYEMNRPVPNREREHIKAETEKFIRSLAALTQANDFGLQQAVYDKDAGKPKVVNFLGDPKLFDSGSDLSQPDALELWHDPEFSKKYGENVGTKNFVSLAMYKFITNLIQNERSTLKAADNCNAILDGLTTDLKPTIPLSPQGPTGT